MLPREWELRLLEAKRISTYRLAIELLYLHWYGKGEPITVSSKVAKAAKISVRSKWNALDELERLGLIEVDRKPRKVAARRPAPHPDNENMSTIVHSHMARACPRFSATWARSCPRGPYSLFLFSLL